MCACVCARARVCDNLQCHDIHTKFHETAFIAAIIITRNGNKILSPGELPASPVDPVLQ